MYVILQRCSQGAYTNDLQHSRLH